MRRRFIITSSIAIILFAVCLFGINVYAKMNQSFSISNTIAFEPSNDVYVSLNCSVSGCTQANLTTPPSGYESIEAYRQAIGLVHTFEFEEVMRGPDFKNLFENDKWNIAESLTFVNASTPIVYQIVVYNWSLVPIEVSFVDYIGYDNDHVSEFIENTISPANGVRIEAYSGSGTPASQTITLTTKVKVSDRSFSDESNDFKINFNAIYEW